MLTFLNGGAIISAFFPLSLFSVITDINECEYMQQVCPFGCENTIGSYRCKDASTSTPPPDEVEIVTTNIVEPYTTEVSAPVKTCGAGMTLDASNICIDIDECAEGNTGCEHCENSIGSYGKRTNAIESKPGSRAYGIARFHQFVFTHSFNTIRSKEHHIKVYVY